MTALLTYCTCVDPRRINPATGHYPGCPDEIIPPECLLPPWEAITIREKGRPVKNAQGVTLRWEDPTFRTELVPGRAWTAPVERVSSTAAPSADAPDEPAILVVLDTETTGFRKAGAVVGVCEIALCVADLSAPGEPRVIAHHGKLLDPGMPIPSDATRVHGITDAMVKGAPRLADIFPRIVAWVAEHAARDRENAQIIAHSAPYDREVIADVCRAHGIALPPWSWRCSMQLAKKVAPGLPSYSLHDDPSKGKVGLATSLGLRKGTSHRAMGDVITTVSLLGALRARAGAWSAWRGDAVVWGAAKPVEAAKGAEKPVESAPVPAAVPPAPASVPKTVKGRARPVPSGPSLFDRITSKESA